MEPAAQGDNPDVVVLDEVLQVGRGDNHGGLGCPAVPGGPGFQRCGVPGFFPEGFVFVELEGAPAGDETDGFFGVCSGARMGEGEEGYHIVVYPGEFGEAVVEEGFGFGCFRGFSGVGVPGAFGGEEPPEAFEFGELIREAVDTFHGALRGLLEVVENLFGLSPGGFAHLVSD